MNFIRNAQEILKQVTETLQSGEKENKNSTAIIQQGTSEQDSQATTAEQQAAVKQEMSEQEKAQQELIEQAIAAFKVGRASLCLERWELVRKRFPALPQGYIQAGFMTLDLGNITLAENLAAQAIEKFPHMYNAFQLYAEVAMRSCAFSLALSRWALVRKHFPTQPQGYIQAGIAALEQGNIALAENFLAQAEKKFPNESTIGQLRNHIAEAKKQNATLKARLDFSALLDIAENDLRMGLFKLALEHFKIAMKHTPMQIRAFRGAVKAALRLQDYRSVKNIAREMIARFPLSIEGYQYQIQCLEAREAWAEALAELDRIKEKFPQHPFGWQKSAEIQLKTANYERADAEITEAVKLFPRNLALSLYFAQLPLNAADPEIKRTSMKRCLNICQQFSTHYNAFLQALNICSRAITLQNDKYYYDTYRCILNSFLHRFKTNDSSNTKKKDTIALYSHRIEGLKYILPVLRCLPPDFIDIILGEKDNTTDTINKFQIGNYNIKYGNENVKDYKYILIDVSALMTVKGIKEQNCNFIGYPHATDARLEGVCEYLSLAIFASKNQMTSPKVLSCTPLPDWYTLPAHANYKCELCYTGPYHIGEFLERRHEEKIKIKAELAEQLQIEIPRDKPLIFILEDEFCHMGQLSYAANHMTQYATVIFKSLLPIRDPRLTKFNNDVYMLRGPFAPNLLRFAADFVCCGYMSGSFTTSVMLGQNVLPYYSRLVRRRTMPTPYFPQQPYDKFMSLPEPPFRSATHIIYSKFYTENKLLDLANAASFKEAILGTEYKDWYQSNLPSLQKEAFGDYLLEGAPQKTADYIMRFVKEGTLGKDCTSVFLKQKYFI